MTTEKSSSKTASATVYLMEELGDARMRCDQLVRYVAQATKLVENSSHRDHFFEVAGHLIQGIPHTLFLLQKALQATALAATRLDYEEIKADLRPEKVDELERALQDVRVRQVQRRSDPWTPGQAAQAIRGMITKVRESGHLPKTELMALILGLEFGLKKADATTAAQALEAVAESIETADSAPSQLHLAALLRQVFADDLLRTTQEHVTMDKTAMDWKTDNTRTAGAFPEPGAEPTFGMDMVNQGMEEVMSSARAAQSALQTGNTKKMFFRLLGVLNGLGMIGRAYDLPDVGYLMRVYKVFAKMAGAKPAANFSASEDEKQSKFEEGKPADPTENMSPEDAKKWKTEHDKNKDKFKAATSAEEAKRSRFEEGKPADPTENMSPEDAKKWKEEHDKNKDKFKSAGGYAYGR